MIGFRRILFRYLATNKCIENYHYQEKIKILINLPSARNISILTERKCMVPRLCESSVQNIVCRQKGGKATNLDTDSDSDAEDFDEYKQDPLLNKISKISKSNVDTLRLDLMIKTTLKTSRNKIEVLFYESKIRINGEKPTKKSMNINIGDEIDIVKSLNEKNPENINISRVEILDIKSKQDGLSVIYRTYKSLVIENYKDPWNPNSKDPNIK